MSSCQDSTGQNLQVEHRRNWKGKMGKEELEGKNGKGGIKRERWERRNWQGKMGMEELKGKDGKGGIERERWTKGKDGNLDDWKGERRKERERLDSRNWNGKTGRSQGVEDHSSPLFEKGGSRVSFDPPPFLETILKFYCFIVNVFEQIL